MIGLHDHHRGHSTRVARTVEKPSPRSRRDQLGHRQQAYTTPITDSGHAGAGDRETDRAPAESLRDTWSMTLNVNCPHCGEMHAVSVRETYIDDAIRNVSEIARRV
jgi:hypothetical protein